MYFSMDECQTSAMKGPMEDLDNAVYILAPLNYLMVDPSGFMKDWVSQFESHLLSHKRFGKNNLSNEFELSIHHSMNGAGMMMMRQT